MFLSTIPRNLNWEILAEKSYFEKFWYYRGSLKNSIFRAWRKYQ